MTRRTALVTGASAGIGASFARTLAADGHDLLLVARRADRLTELATDLSTRYGVRVETLAADLTDPAAPKAVMAHAADQGLDVDVLINNAGMSGVAAAKLPAILWQDADDVVREGWAAVNAGKPVCVPGTVNKVLSHATRPVPYRLQYALGRTFNPLR